MKKYISIILSAALALSAVSCQKKASEGVTRITYYPTIEVMGANPAVIANGSSFTDPGYVATMNGEDITAQVSVSDNINSSKAGIYSVQYSFVNPDGIKATASRTVIVCNPITSVENVYEVYCQYGSRNYTNPMLIQAVPGGYSIPDWFGGFYCLGRYPGYESAGYDFWAEAVFKINADNSVSLVEYDNTWYFAGSWDETPTASGYDPATGEIYWIIEGALLVDMMPYTVD